MFAEAAAGGAGLPQRRAVEQRPSTASLDGDDDGDVAMVGSVAAAAAAAVADNSDEPDDDSSSAATRPRVVSAAIRVLFLAHSAGKVYCTLCCPLSKPPDGSRAVFASANASNLRRHFKPDNLSSFPGHAGVYMQAKTYPGGLDELLNDQMALGTLRMHATTTAQTTKNDYSQSPLEKNLLHKETLAARVSNARMKNSNAFHTVSAIAYALHAGHSLRSVSTDNEFFSGLTLQLSSASDAHGHRRALLAAQAGLHGRHGRVHEGVREAQRRRRHGCRRRRRRRQRRILVKLVNRSKRTHSGRRDQVSVKLRGLSGYPIPEWYTHATSTENTGVVHVHSLAQFGLTRDDVLKRIPVYWSNNCCNYYSHLAL
jgi:hypothetical protein